MEFNSETAGQAFPIGNSMDSHQAYADRVDGLCQGYVPLTLDVMRVAFKVPLAFHTPL